MTQRPALRPVDAASLLLADLSGPAPRFLMGSRPGGHVFMANRRVFPGGRVEPRDSAGASAEHMPPADRDRLAAEGGSRSRAPAAFAACALREAREETGLVLEAGGLVTPLRYMARAITPPGQVRRYDTRFLIARADRNRIAFAGADGELAEIGWYTATEADDRLHEITRAIMALALDRLSADPTLAGEAAVPCFRVRNGQRVVEYPAGGAFP